MFIVRVVLDESYGESAYSYSNFEFAERSQAIKFARLCSSNPFTNLERIIADTVFEDLATMIGLEKFIVVRVADVYQKVKVVWQDS